MQGSAKSYVVVKQPGQEYMVARMLDSPRNPSPVVIHAISAHAGICVARHACSPVASLHGTSAQPQYDDSIGPQHMHSVQRADLPNQADASQAEFVRIISTGCQQPLQEPVDQVNNMQDPCELLDTGMPRKVAVSVPSCSPTNFPASQQHEPMATQSNAAEACSSRGDTSNCKCCSKGMLLKVREADPGLADTRDEPVAGNMSDQELGRRSSRHSLSTVEACAAFLADTRGLSTLQAIAPESSTKRTVVDSSSGQHKDALQHCQDSEPCSQSVCLASVDGLGTEEQPMTGNQAQPDAACCGDDDDGEAPSRVTSSSNEAWHARMI